MASNEGLSKDLEMDRLVIDWLKKRKLDESAKILEMELQVKAQALEVAAAQEFLTGKNVPLEQALLATRAGGDPDTYIVELNKLLAWVDGSLDAYKPELSCLYYPIFVHTYLQLVAAGAASLAHSVLGANKSRILASASSPRQRKIRDAELHNLLSISNPEQLETSSFATSLRANRTPVRLSQYGYDLVLHYLRQSEMLLMLGSINQWLAIEIVQGQTASSHLEDGGLSGGGGDDAGTINSQELQLKLLQNSASHKYEMEIAETAKDEATKRADEDNVTKREKQARQKTAAEAKEKLDKVDEKFMEPTIPLPAIDSNTLSVLVEDLVASQTAGAGGQPVSSEALPSAAFLTFVNAQQSLCSVNFSSDLTKAACGFSDSTLRTFNLRENSNSASTILKGHAGPVYAADFSPDNQLLISASADGTARLWSTKLSVGLVAYRGHMLPVWDAVFAPEYGNYFATGGADRTARVWTTERIQPLRVFSGHQSDVDVVAWHPNCHYLATGSSDRTVRLWDLRSGSCVRMLLGHNAPITALAVSHDGSRLASGDASGMISNWDVAEARRLATSELHDGPVWSLDYSYGGDTGVIASGGGDCTVRMWDHQLECAATWYTKATPVVVGSWSIVFE